MRRANTLLIMSDEHKRAALGCYGHPIIRTPNLEYLATRGTRFTAAYCNSPIRAACKPELQRWVSAAPAL